MRAIIVDDEKHVRTTVRKLIDWGSLGFHEVLEAENGSEAVRMIQEQHPQLVITDMMMPLTSGIELMQWMEKNAADCKKIVISGYNDFEFVRHTVKYGGLDYLLKPIDRKQLLDAVSRAADSVQELEQDKRQLQAKNMEVNELKPMYKDQLLSRLLAEAASGNVPVPGESYLREFRMLADVRTCEVAVIDLLTLPESIRSKYASNPDLLYFSLLNICNDILDGTTQGTAFRNWNSPYEIIVLIWADPDTSMTWLRQIESSISRILKGSAEIGISPAKVFPNDLHLAYRQAQEALNRRNLLESASRLHVFRPSSPTLGTLRFSRFEEKLRLAVRSGNAGQIRSTVDEWFNLVAAMDRITMEQLKLWWDEFTVAKAAWMEEFFSECPDRIRIPAEAVPFALSTNEDGSLSLPALHDQLTNHLIELSGILVSLLAPSNQPMREIARYLEANYLQDISLQEISDKFHMNREYISRKFKQENQETIGDFVSRIRVEKAKMLLANPYLRISQIAQMVGYQDEKYFSRVFKKVVQISPNEFRKGLS